MDSNCVCWRSTCGVCLSPGLWAARTGNTDSNGSQRLCSSRSTTLSACRHSIHFIFSIHFDWIAGNLEGRRLSRFGRSVEGRLQIPPLFPLWLDGQRGLYSLSTSHCFHTHSQVHFLLQFRMCQIEMYMFRYSLNGFAHHVHRGDWFGGKV